jgi:hypothetical protein
MLQIVKLHLGLYKYLKIELSKKKFKEGFKFVISLTPVYLKELLHLYKNLFLILDADYQKQKAQYKKIQNLKVDLQRCIKILKYVDEKIQKSGLPRQQRRRFWEDFRKHGQIRKETLDQLLKEINQIGG